MTIQIVLSKIISQKLIFIIHFIIKKKSLIFIKCSFNDKMTGRRVSHLTVRPAIQQLSRNQHRVKTLFQSNKVGSSEKDRLARTR